MGCATGTIKYTLFILNSVWSIVGVLVILFAALGYDAMPQKYAIGFFVLGGVIIIISFFGCCGAVRESARMLWIYVNFLLLLLVLIIVFMCYSTRDVFKRHALRSVEDFWNKEITKPGAMDTMQITYACCGRLSAEDYFRMGRTPPASCCKEKNCINPLNLNVIGCLTKVEEAFADEQVTTKYYEWGLLTFNIIILTLATLLAIHYTNRKRRFSY